MSSVNKEIIAAIKKVLPDVECVIGWGPGPDALHAAPCFITSEAEADASQAGFFAVNNPALYLPEYRGKKVAVVAKGCDSRSIGQLVAEELVNREEVHIIGYPCEGVISQDRLAGLLLSGETGLGVVEPGSVESVREEGEVLVLVAGGKEARIKKADVLAGKCARCRYPNAVHVDTFVGEQRAPVADKDEYADLQAFEKLSYEERKEFWEKEMSRCIRCYACRNACPLCVCRDHCIAQSRDPQWITQADGVREKLFFQVIHSMHLAGRCTGCGECERACPVGLPLLLLRRTLSRRVEDLFGFEAGVKTDAEQPLQTFKIEEPRIKERHW